MTKLLFELPLDAAGRSPEAPALWLKGHHLRYAELGTTIDAVARGLIDFGLARLDRVAVYLPKQFETVTSMFGAVRAGCVFVPVNALLKPDQVGHILRDCNVRVLVTSAERALELAPTLAGCNDLRHLVSIGNSAPISPAPHIAAHGWYDLTTGKTRRALHRVIDADVASIFYTSGSTGRPKGVVLSHRNMVTGAHSVAEYLHNVPEDKLLAVLPFSFDYGFSQLSTAFSTGASVVLMDYLFAKDVIALAGRERVTGLAGVPPLWMQLADLPWPAEARDSLRYFTNSGGAMPRSVLDKLRTALPKTLPYLMYGLTEAFRSTYLPPEEVDRRPDSMGKAIPNAEILVVNADGKPCTANEAGELVHRGSLVALGYWNDPAKTAERFKPSPNQEPGIVMPEIAVWSGDTVRRDEDGFLYFVGRRDEMIKTSGYRVSPTEIEEVVYATGLVMDAVAVGVPHKALGQAIVVVAAPVAGTNGDGERLLAECRLKLPTFMIPLSIEWRDSLPRNPNGKFDRTRLAAELRSLFTREDA
jgi:acyl-CoA ligase (AMP-forming) (exosortase A-associated)